MEDSTRKLLRREGNTQGGVLLIYHGLMAMCVMLCTVMGFLMEMLRLSISGMPLDMILNHISSAAVDMTAESGNWGYILTVVMGMLALLLWKKPGYLRSSVFASGSRMNRTHLFGLTAIFLSVQIFYRVWYYLLEAGANRLGFSFESLAQQVSVSGGSLPMFLYACFLAPITEEILFRGVVLRSLAPYGKKFAIVVSALLFGLFHGNILQAPFAAMTGLVMAFVTLEYHIGWAIGLHLMNNLLLGELLPRVLGLLPPGVGDLILLVFLLLCTLAAAIVLILHWREIRVYWKTEKAEKGTCAAFFRAPAMIVFLILSVINILSLPLLALWAG